jgi:DUF4097 and DUF4098 domain-containing protein YvlB
VGRWIFGFAALGICCFVLLGALFFFIGGRHWRRPARPGLPPPPPPVAQTDEAALGEEGAEITGDKTVITRAFPLGARARVMVENLNGDITLEGWDQPRAEVKVTKRGGSADDRRAVPVEFSRDEDELSLKTEAGRNSGVNVTYEIKVPRNLGEVKINATNSSIKLANIEGLFEVETRNGSINLVDVSGAAQAKTTNGSIKAAFKQIAPDEPLELEGVNGSIELRTGGDVNADLEAQTITGTITLDDSFGVRVEKRLVGQKADGRLGEGGRPITVKTVNGSIKITK